MFSRIAAARGRTIVCTLIVTSAAACTDTTAPSTTATATQVADADCGTVTSLSPGQVVTGVGATSLCIAGGTSGGEFALVPFNTSLDGSSGTPFTVQANGVSATAVASLIPNKGTFNVLAGTARASTTLSSVALTRVLDAKLRASEARDLTPRIAAARAWMRSRQRTTSGSVPGVSLSVVPSTAQVGQLVTLNANTESACASPDLRTGRIAAVGNKAIIVADVSNPASGYTDADYASIASMFDNLVDPTDTKAFGSPTDIDGNGHVVLFFTRAVNELPRREARHTSRASSTHATCSRRRRPRTSTRARGVTAARCSTSWCPTRPAS